MSKHIAELHIVKHGSCLYEGVLDGQPSGIAVASISEVLSHFGEDISTDYAQFVNVSYGPIHLATTSVEDLALRAEALAGELVAIATEIDMS